MEALHGVFADLQTTCRQKSPSELKSSDSTVEFVSVDCGKKRVAVRRISPEVLILP